MDEFYSLNYQGENFENEWRDVYQRKYYNSLDELKESDKIKAILKCVESLLINLKEFYEKCIDDDSTAAAEKDMFHFYIFKLFANDLDSNSNDLNKETINRLVDLFILCSTIPKLTVFKIKALRYFLSIFVRVKIENLSKQQVSTIIESLQIKFDLDGYYFKEAHNVWRFGIEDFLSNFGEQFFLENIEPIQKLFEFTVMNSTSKPYSEHPYNFISSKIVHIMSYFKTLKCQSIYFNLVDDNTNKNGDVKFINLIEMCKNFLIDEKNDFYEPSFSKFIIEIRNVLIYESKNSSSTNNIILPFFENHHKLVYESIIDVFINSNRNVARKTMFSFLIAFGDAFAKSKKANTKEFHLFFLKKLIESVEFILNKIKSSAQSDDQNEKESTQECYKIFVEHFFRFNRIITDQIKDKQTVKPCIDLIILLMQLPIDIELLKQLESLTRKENYFNFKNHPDETLKIFDYIFYFIYNIFNIVKDAASHSRSLFEYSSTVKNIGENIASRIKLFDQIVEITQPILFDKVICRPIEENIQLDEFYYMIIPFYKIISFKRIPQEENDLKRLKNVFRMAISPDIFDSIQPDQCKRYDQLVNFYFSFFTLISLTLNDRPDINSLIENDLLDFLKILDEKDEFVNELYGGKTVNYDLLNIYSMSLLKNSHQSENIINFLNKIWFRLKETQEATILNDFNSILFFNSEHFPKLLSKYSDILWKDYTNNFSLNLVNPIMKTFEYSLDVFAKYEDIYYSLLIENKDNYLTNNISLLFKISELKPEFFFKNLNTNNNLVIFDLIDFITKYKIFNFWPVVIHIFTKLIEALNKDLNLLNKFYEILYLNRRNIFIIIAIDPQTKKKDWDLFSSNTMYNWQFSIGLVCNFYLTLIENTDKQNEIDDLISDLIEIYNILKIKECETIFHTIRKGFSEKERIGFLKKYQNMFIKIKEEESLNQIKESVSLICDMIEGRNLESLGNKIDENLTQITKLDTNVKGAHVKITKLDTNVKKHEIKITNLNSNIENVSGRVDNVEVKVEEQEKKIVTIDEKTLLNVPLWCKNINNLIEKNYEWILVAKRLNYTENDIKAWLTQQNPSMNMLQEWFIANKTSDATLGLLKVFKELNNLECVNIIETNMKNVEINHKDAFIDEDELDNKLLNDPPQVFISFEWSSKEKAELLKKYLDRFDIDTWFDDGKMGGGNVRNNRIDRGIRLCKVLVCLITEKSSKDQTCLNEINLAVQLNKSILPLLLDEKLKWPPSGPMGPILSEYLFIRFFQRPKEITNDERYWPVEKFDELIMQLRHLVPTKKSKIDSNHDSNLSSNRENAEVFISYQWDKQKQIIKLYNKLTNMGLNVWLDIYQMGGGDSLYDKIDKGLRNCNLVISCITTKYGQSANCRKEIALADSLSKPIIPILLESNMKYPPAGPMAPTLSLLKYVDFSKSQEEQETWSGKSFDELIEQIKPHLSDVVINRVVSKACVIS